MLATLKLLYKYRYFLFDYDIINYDIINYKGYNKL